MKMKELLYLAGIKPKPRTYGHETVAFDLPRTGLVQFAQWQHPRYPRQELTEAALDAYRRYIRPGDVAIDIGAHTGDSTLPLALAAGPTGMVFALEPNRYVFSILQVNAALNRDKANILPLMFAATPTDGPMSFEYSDAGFCNGGNHESLSTWRHAHAFKLQVEGKNLLRYLQAHHPAEAARVRFIKVDAEGYDHTVLTTLAPLLQQCKPFIKAEVFKLSTEAQRVSFLQFLTALGYRVHRMEGETCFEGPLLTPHNLMEKRHYDLFAVPW